MYLCRRGNFNELKFFGINNYSAFKTNEKSLEMDESLIIFNSRKKMTFIQTFLPS